MSRFKKLIYLFFMIRSTNYESVDGILSEHRITVERLNGRAEEMAGKRDRLQKERDEKRERLEREMAELEQERGLAELEQERAKAAAAQLNKVFGVVDSISLEA